MPKGGVMKLFDLELRKRWVTFSLYEKFEHLIISLLTIIIAVIVGAATWQLILNTITLVRGHVLDPRDSQVFHTVFGMDSTSSHLRFGSSFFVAGSCFLVGAKSGRNQQSSLRQRGCRRPHSFAEHSGGYTNLTKGVLTMHKVRRYGNLLATLLWASFAFAQSTARPTHRPIQIPARPAALLTGEQGRQRTEIQYRDELRAHLGLGVMDAVRWRPQRVGGSGEKFRRCSRPVMGISGGSLRWPAQSKPAASHSRCPNRASRRERAACIRLACPARRAP